MNQLVSSQHKRSRWLMLLTLSSLTLVTGCAPHTVTQEHHGAIAQVAPPVLPEERNQANFAEPVVETEVVQVYGYPMVDEFESQPL